VRIEVDTSGADRTSLSALELGEVVGEGLSDMIVELRRPQRVVDPYTCHWKIPF
jgi:hypothetical protein